MKRVKTFMPLQAILRLYFVVHSHQ